MITTQLTTIKLSGKLARLFGHVHRLAVETPAEAIRALCVMKPGFEKFLMEAKDNGLVFAVHVGKKNVSENELRNQLEPEEEIRLVPVIVGSKNSGILTVIVGVVLVVIGVILSFTPFAAAAPFFINAGIGMIAAGVVQLLMPGPKKPKTSDSPDNQASDIFNGAVNVQAQGNPVPLLYGELLVGSAVASAGISTQDNYTIPTSGAGGAGSVRGGGGYSGDVSVRFQNAAQ